MSTVRQAAIASVTLALVGIGAWAQVPFQYDFPVAGEYLVSLPGTVSSPVIERGFGGASIGWQAPSR